MDIKQLSPAFAVTGQVTPAGIEEAAQLGFRAVVCNRPDDEAAEQPSSLEWRRLRRGQGSPSSTFPSSRGAIRSRGPSALGALWALSRARSWDIVAQAHAPRRSGSARANCRS